MSNNVVKYGFIAGEISPTLYGRTDLTAYDMGVAEAQNYFVDYRGGLSSRPGTAFCEFVKADAMPTKMAEFSFSPDLSDTYVMFFGHNYVRFLQEGNYVLETGARSAAFSVSGSVVNFNSNAHGIEAGRWILITGVTGVPTPNNFVGRMFEVTGVSINQFRLRNVPDGVDLTPSASGASGTIQFRVVYELPTPYAGSDLADLGIEQYRDYVRLTHQNYPIYNLIRSGHDDWELEPERLAEARTGPAVSSITASDTGSAQVIFAVTSVDEDGNESLQGTLRSSSGIVNYTIEEGSVTVRWARQLGALYYNVYRSVVASNGNLDSGVQLGYVGMARGTSFVDPNIVPDFTRQPPVHYNPFAPGAIEDIEVVTQGTGYTPFATSVTASGGGGTGFRGQVIVNSSGGVVGIRVLAGGSGYVSPVITIFGGTGTGATATATARPVDGTYPALSSIFQQRQVYAASENSPTTLWGSRTKQLNNFAVSDMAMDNESYEFTLDTKAIAPIRHLIPTRGGLLCLTQENIWLLNGGGASLPITPNQSNAEPQTYIGTNKLRPIPIDSDLLFVEGKGHAVRLLAYNELSKVYSGEDRSILSNHLFGEGKEILAWSYQENPFKTVWCARADGAMLAFTIVKSEEVYAWTHGKTKGRYLDVLSCREGTRDRVYWTVERKINGRWTKFIERMSVQQFVNVEDAWCVDCGLALDGMAPQTTIYITFDPDRAEPWQAHGLGTHADTAGGKVLRGGDGIYKVKRNGSNGTVDLDMLELPNNFIPETDDRETYLMPAGTWTLDTPVTSFGGLWHLEGEMVSILADGNVFPKQRVTEGRITLDRPVTRAVIGLQFTCSAKTLPLIIPDAGIESRRKRVVGLGVRLSKSRGLRFGSALNNLYEMRERTNERMGQPTRMINGIRYQFISTNWQEDSQTYFVQTDPLPVTLLSFSADTEVGDDPD